MGFLLPELESSFMDDFSLLEMVSVCVSDVLECVVFFRSLSLSRL